MERINSPVKRALWLSVFIIQWLTHQSLVKVLADLRL